MERRDYMDDGFEQFLRNATENFRMYPDRKVWYSIYNNTHPSKKWPSLSVLLLLIASVMMIGVSNNQGKIDDAVLNNLKVFNETFQQIASKTSRPTFDITPSNILQSLDESTTPSNSHSVNAANVNAQTKNNLSANRRLEISIIPSIAITKPAIALEEPTTSIENSYALNDETSSLSMLNQNEALSFDKMNIPMSDADLLLKNIDFDQTAIARLKKKSNDLSFHLYATPSYGYRSLRDETDFPVEAYMPMSLISNPDNDEPVITHNPAISWEIGGGVYYQLNKTIRLKAGLQLNFTNYNIQAIGLSHAANATYMFSSSQAGVPEVFTQSTYISNVGNGDALSLKSHTTQFVLPIGADFQIAGNQNIKWNAGVTFQPTYVSGGSAFILSADQRHYIADPSIIRRFNFNGGVETFISYQPFKGITLNVGPQLRYQFLSTYKEKYPLKEHLYQMGVKFGVTTRF